MSPFHEAVLRDRDLDIDGREKLYAEAPRLNFTSSTVIRVIPVGKGETDRVLPTLSSDWSKG